MRCITAWLTCFGVLAGTCAGAAEPVRTVAYAKQAELLDGDNPTLGDNKRIVYREWRHRHDDGALVSIVADGDAVVLATLDRFEDPTDRDIHFETVRFDYYRLADGKIIEHHSTPRFSLAPILQALGQPAPSEPPPPGHAAAGAVPLDRQAENLLGSPDPRVATNKRVAFDFFRVALVSGHLETTPQYATESYIQHNPTIPSGRDALVAALSKFIKPSPTISAGIPGLVRVVAERDMVVLVQQRVVNGVGTWMFDMFRVTDGKVAEHWDSPREAAEVGAVRKNDPNNLFPAALAASSSEGASHATTGTATPITSSHEALQGVWLIEQPVFAAKTIEGKLPALTPAGAALYQQHIAARRVGDTTFDDTRWCGSPGIPRLMLMDRPFQIVLQPNDTTLFYYEWNRWARLVYMTHSKLAVIGTSSMGVATGDWDGDTLVVTSEGFRPDTLLDGAGLPHSEQLHVTERLRLMAPDVLEDKISIDDPAFYLQPWQMRVTYRHQQHTEIGEDVCLDRAATAAVANSDGH